jgi:hypothetical protein
MIVKDDPSKLAGLLDMSREVIAIADTAIVCQLAYPLTSHTLGFREVLARPHVP